MKRLLFLVQLWGRPKAVWESPCLADAGWGGGAWKISDQFVDAFLYSWHCVENLFLS